MIPAPPASSVHFLKSAFSESGAFLPSATICLASAVVSLITM